jgi:hypothetical protein
VTQFAVINQATNDDITVPKFNQNGAVELYYDNVKKFETTSDGIDVSNILQVGTTNDTGELRIGHDGSSYRARLVSNSSNSLEIDADGPERILMHGGVIYMKPLNSEISAAFVANGAVELYHDNTKMFSTESRGAILQKADACTFIIGSTNAGSAQLFLDGDSNGDGNGGDYSGIRHNSAGHLEIFADNPSTNASIYFKNW